MSDFKRILAKLQPVPEQKDYVSDNYGQKELAQEVSDKSLMLSPEDVHKILNAESSGGQFLRNPASSAKGNFQILDKTRQEALNELKKQGITDIPANPDRQDALLMGNLVDKSENALLNSKTGPKDPNLENIYLAHHFGVQGALNALNDPKKPINKARFQNVRSLLNKKPLTTIDDGEPAKNLLDLLKD
jgi:hypothetical protein